MLPSESTPLRSAADGDTVAMIADALIRKFGGDALQVARLQRDLTIDTSLARWDEIVARLQG